MRSIRSFVASGFLICSTFHHLCFAGVQDFSGCKEDSGPAHLDQSQQLGYAWWDVNAIAHAGLAALNTHDDKRLYNYFFKPENEDYVRTTLENLIRLSENPHDLTLRCDMDGICRDTPDQWGGSYWLGKSWYISLCDYGLDTLERNEAPCTTSPGVPSLGWVMVKYMVQLWNVVAVAGDNAIGPSACHKQVTDPKGEPHHNAENYAYFTSWAYDLGYLHGDTCLDHWNTDPQTVLPTWSRQGISNT
ncbi:MAG: hypothetical protein LQ350_008546 [Teloschistes chrysophthalmus]|nr:MAG: hypothetical protein LQ350_008546 [Niorma chrysophthalma]